MHLSLKRLYYVYIALTAVLLLIMALIITLAVYLYHLIHASIVGITKRTLLF